MKSFKLFSNGLIFIFCFFILTPFSLGEIVKKIHPDGIIETDQGRKIALAGIHLAETAPLFLTALLAGKELSFEAEKNYDAQDPSAPVPGYVSVKTEELDFPFKELKTKQVTLRVNQQLLRLGIAEVDKNRPFDAFDEFLQLEEEARQKGRGIWSYELPPLKKK